MAYIDPSQTPSRTRLETLEARRPERSTRVVASVRVGNLTVNDSSGGFRGVIIAAGNEVDTGRCSGVGVEGSAVASGDMTIRGGVSPSTVSLTTCPGLYCVRLWSWRELYE